ncbi:nucleoid DNA-binding protein [Nannocystis exedens]|uniref:Nucleoid DNA-binding protein n=1 Tax=Nannocystis exedens TaxID=54 RepID=A0A1I2GCQ9_9BACT|nr:HU family DNA-binding protein [Nannocystis exedens]PCC67427.1 DNA-binding protein HU [Nannocystis exedens]SFF14780.1 nucleoid DNA-binding protein [Nannocystis exedens]
MTKAELIEKIARNRDLPPDITKKCVQQILEIAFGELSAYFVKARVTRAQSPRFTFPGFGTFTKKKRSARKGVNPRTLEPMTIDAAFTIDFRPGVELRASLNAPAGKAPAARKRRAIPAQLELQPPSVDPTELDEVDEDEVGDEADEADEALILRRRFTAREDLEEDDADDEFDEVSLEVLRRQEPADPRLELPPAPMQRADPPGRRAHVRTGSRS